MVKKIVIDLDGVVFDTQLVLQYRLNKKGYSDFSLSRILCYDFNKSLTPEGQTLLQEGNDSRYPYFCNAPREEIFSILADPSIYDEALTTGAVEWQPTLRASLLLSKLMAHPCFDIVFQSVCSSRELAEAKNKALKSLFRNRNYTFEPVFEDVKPQIEEASYIIEDNIRVAKTCSVDEQMSDGKPLLLLIRKPWNNPVYDSTIKDTDNVYNVSVASLYEALKYIYERECSHGFEC